MNYKTHDKFIEAYATLDMIGFDETQKQIVFNAIKEAHVAYCDERENDTANQCYATSRVTNDATDFSEFDEDEDGETYECTHIVFTETTVTQTRYHDNVEVMVDGEVERVLDNKTTITYTFGKGITRTEDRETADG